ncbi:hypothetical protein B0A50_08051 [Salinomyces thailandicus]|uniref:MGS207 protein n=1 Tax=Salinomyces thailandicus TaxID=706561 RepID=A0A4U0TKT4_9PEZI|nr:hypothetical protein B0A50_08051 [Salinomyces thailandica]
MFQFRLPQIFSSFPTVGGGGGIKLPKPDVHDVEERPEKRARTLKHLLKHNHITHSVIYNQLRFHNHVPHILATSYIFGADSDQLTHIYEAESKHLEPWRDSPGEISQHDWRDFLGKREYQRAFVDFFEDQLVRHGYDWHALLDEYLLQGPEPLVNNLISGLGHPLIHLGYAHELSSRTVAIEALALAACFYNDWHIYLDDPQYTRPSPNPSDSLFTLLDRVAHDKTFDNLPSSPGSTNIDTLLTNKALTEALLQHWNAWDLQNPKAQFAESQKLVVALLVASTPRQQAVHHDFFLVHLLTTSHAVRTLLPCLPARFHIPLLKQWWFLTLLIYIAQLRPQINIDAIKLVDLDGRNWTHVKREALLSRYRTDAHYVKALRSMHEASKVWGDPNGFYLRAAVKFGEEFEGWGGFGAADKEVVEVEGGRRYSGQGEVSDLS